MSLGNTIGGYQKNNTVTIDFKIDTFIGTISTSNKRKLEKVYVRIIEG